jgi:hypothetical protein
VRVSADLNENVRVTRQVMDFPALRWIGRVGGDYCATTQGEVWSRVVAEWVQTKAGLLHT